MTVITEPETTDIMISSLRLIRIPDIDLVPDYLFEQVENRRWDVVELRNAVRLNPGNILAFAMLNEKNETKGIIMGLVDELEKCLFIAVLSVDKAYQFKKKILPDVHRFLLALKDHLGLNSITMRTSRPKVFETFGYKIIDHIMEVK